MLNVSREGKLHASFLTYLLYKTDCPCSSYGWMGDVFAPFLTHTGLALCQLSPFTLASPVSGMFE